MQQEPAGLSHMNTKAKWASVLVVIAGMMGLAGVMTAAAGTHLAAGDTARIAADFLLIHAAVILAASNSVQAGWSGTAMLMAASVLALGASVFGADLALASLGGIRPFPLAAPLGGFGMIAGWLLVMVAGCRQFFGTRG